MSRSESRSPTRGPMAVAVGLALLIAGCGFTAEPPVIEEGGSDAAASATPDAEAPVLTEAELLALSEEVFERLMPLRAAMSGGPDTVRGKVTVDFEGDLDAAREALGDLADHPAVEVTVPPCAVWDPADAPAEAMALPGDGSNCGGMQAAIEGILVGDATTGCVTFGGGTTILWPAGWTITPDGTIHDQHGEPRVAIGDLVEAAGGFLGDGSDAVPEECRTGPSDGGVSIHGIRKTD